MNFKSIKLNYAKYIIYLIAFFTFIKIIFNVMIGPIYGYANNYDFIRQSSCVGIWETYKNKPKTSSNPEAPVNNLLYDGDVDSSACMKSVDNIFPLIARSFHGIGDVIDFREISLWKIIFLLASFALLIYIANGALVKLAISTTFFLVFGDIANLLYANTMYNEFSVIIGIFFALFYTAIIATSGNRNIGLIIISLIYIAWLGFSKEQYAFLTIFLGIVTFAALAVNGKRYRLAAFFLLTSVISPLVFNYINSSNTGLLQSINYANKTDTFLGAVLPAATNKVRALHVLDLPHSCITGIGDSWYTPGVQENHPCPEVEHLSRLSLIKLFLVEPSTFITPISKGLTGLAPFYPSYLGQFEGGKDEHPMLYKFLKKSSFSGLINLINKDTLKTLSVLMFFTGIPMLFIGVFFNKNDYNHRFLFIIFGLGGVVAIYSVFSSVFGDGYAELQKHSVGFLIGLSFQVVGLTFLCINLLSKIISKFLKLGAT